MEKLIKKLNSAYAIKKINENMYEINNNITVFNNIDVKIYIKKEENKIFLTDRKNIVKNMNNIYELASKDVKSCINEVLKFYNFKLSKGEISTEVTEENIVQKYYDFIMCYAQLINMFLFFDDPNK